MHRPIVLTAALLSAASAPASDAAKGLTAVEGLTVGHHTLAEKPSGCTVVLTGKGATAGVDVRGGSPGTRETALLDPTKRIREAHAIVLSGGSAYGLDVASGVMRYLEERGIGVSVARGAGVVPIVPAAILFDLPMGGKFALRPDADCGYKAALAASDAEVAEGNVGAGAGATIGKLAGRERAMKAGLGSAAIVHPDGLVVAAIVAVNAIGSIVDPVTGRVVAGLRSEDGESLADGRALLLAGKLMHRPPRRAEATTIGVVATNATLSQAEAQKMAQMAHDGLARAIWPAHLTGDGDTIFALATGRFEGEAYLSLIGALGAEAMAQAIVRAATEATGLPGYPAARDLAGGDGAR